MANKKDLDFTYTTIDKLFRLSIGEAGDYSGANEFRHQVAIFLISPNRLCFEQEIMDHYRLVFEKT